MTPIPTETAPAGGYNQGKAIQIIISLPLPLGGGRGWATSKLKTCQSPQMIIQGSNRVGARIARPCLS